MPETIPEFIRVGSFHSSIKARLIPSDDGSPTVLALAGRRAHARYLLARQTAGTVYDQTTKSRHWKTEDLLTQPFSRSKTELLQALTLAGLELEIDQAALASMSARSARILAEFSRWEPVEDEDGEVVDWRFVESGVAPADRARAKAAVDDLGWKDHLFAFAYEGLQEMATKQDVFITMSMGTGKSRAALALADTWRHLDGTSAPVVVLAKRRHLEAWREELGGVPGKPPCQLLIDRYGPKPYEEWVLAGDRPRFDKPFLLLSLDRAVLLGKDEERRFLHMVQDTTVILDEAYVCANPQTQMTKFLLKVDARHHVALSGTPIKSRPAQLAAPLAWVHRGGSVALPRYPLGRAGVWKRWNEDWTVWAVNTNTGARRSTPFIKDPEAFWDMLAPLMFRRVRNAPDVEAVLGKAEVESIEHRVDLSPGHHATYKAVLKGFIDWYMRELAARYERGEGAGSIPENEVLIKLGYLVNNVRAPWRMDDHSDDELSWPAHPREPTSIHRKAVDIAKEEVEDGNGCIVFGVSVDAMKLVAETLEAEGIATAVMHGGVPHGERSRILAACRRGEVQVLVGTYGVIAEGWNMSWAQRAVLLDTDWSPSTMAQAVGRITRGVQEVPPRVHYVMAAGTIQEYMVRLGRLKSAAISQALDRRSLTVSEADIPDPAAYIASLVAVNDPEEVPEALFFVEGGN